MKKYLVFFLLAVTQLTGCDKQTEAAVKVERPASTVVVGALGRNNGNIYSGEVHARNEAVLGFRIPGKIVERLVDAGAKVKKGQLMARLDAADTGLHESAAVAQFNLAQEDLKRYQELRDKGFVSQSAMDAKETALKAAAAQAGLARNQATYTSLLSDRDGVVSATLAEVGQVVGAGQAVVRVAEDGGREVQISIPESRYSSIKVGMSAVIELNSTGSGIEKLSGHVREVAPAADAASRTYAAKVSFDSTRAKPVLGMTARVKLNEAGKNYRKTHEGFLIPLSSIYQKGEQAAVWVVAADRSVALRPVVVANYRDDGALVTKGIAAGERIVSAGVHKIASGEKIRIVENGKFL